jgi:hypothetical protein
MSKDAEKNIGLGQIIDCYNHGKTCGYNCCKQSKPDEPDFGPDNALLLYPGEYESAAATTRNHILIVLEDFHGGKLGYCDRDYFDQSGCRAESNFKPLDCQSYPFAPAIVGDGLVLMVDAKRCPLQRKTLELHYRTIMAKWNESIQKNPEIIRWIKKLNLQNYEKF